eukprot:UN12549
MLRCYATFLVGSGYCHASGNCNSARRNNTSCLFILISELIWFYWVPNKFHTIVDSIILGVHILLIFFKPHNVKTWGGIDIVKTLDTTTLGQYLKLGIPT